MWIDFDEITISIEWRLQLHLSNLMKKLQNFNLKFLKILPLLQCKHFYFLFSIIWALIWRMVYMGSLVKSGSSKSGQDYGKVKYSPDRRKSCYENENILSLWRTFTSDPHIFFIAI
jgi:hypothetical protein